MAKKVENNKSWRIDAKIYAAKSKEIINKRESVSQWADLSLDPTLSNDERMLRVMMNNDICLRQPNYICQSYMCSVISPSEDFVRDLIYVNSGLAVLGKWDERVIDWVLDVYAACVDKTNQQGTSAFTGNAIVLVKSAYEEELFKNTYPYYHAFLGALLAERYELQKKIEEFKVDSTDILTLCDSYTDIFELVKKYKNYVVPVTNRLDWKLMDCRNLSPEFQKKYKKHNNIAEEKQDNLILDSLKVKKTPGRKKKEEMYE